MAEGRDPASGARALIEVEVRDGLGGSLGSKASVYAEVLRRDGKKEWAYARACRTSATRTLMLAGFLNRYNSRRRHRGLGNVTSLSRLEAPGVNNVLVSDT